jgi:hypothetical protein
MDDKRQTALLREYGEVCSNFRTLTDIRFKLLAFLPIAAAAAAALRGGLGGVAEFSLSLFGLVVTLALATYNERNDQLYDHLVGRAAAIERSLGLPDGGFANRLGAWLTLGLGGGKWRVNHSSAVNLIYASSAALWLFGILSPLLEGANAIWVGASLPAVPVKDPAMWIKLSALLCAIGGVAVGIRSVSKQKEGREAQMRSLARKAARAACERPFNELLADDPFLQDCADLAAAKKKVIWARLHYFQKLDPKSLAYYMPLDSSEVKGAHLVALLTDVPAQWVFDCLTNRRGALDGIPQVRGTSPKKGLQVDGGDGAGAAPSGPSARWGWLRPRR